MNEYFSQFVYLNWRFDIRFCAIDHKHAASILNVPDDYVEQYTTCKKIVVPYVGIFVKPYTDYAKEILGKEEMPLQEAIEKSEKHLSKIVNR